MNKEPYRATRLWNEIICAFRSGLPSKKHRRRMVTYTECFTATEAVTWLHCYLMNNPNFGLDVTRQQTIQLLQKFLTCHVLESVVCKSKKSEFGDNMDLFRFTQMSPKVTKTLALRSIQSPHFDLPNKKENTQKKVPLKTGSHQVAKELLPECHFIEKKLSLEDIGAIWKTAVLRRLDGFLSLYASVSDVLDAKAVSGHHVRHNICRLSKTGVVSLIDKTDDIPHWVISAMKCLANWPNASGSGSCLPNYPGFEKDVFKVVRDFFLNPQVPLLPASLTLTLLHVFSLCFDSRKNVSPSVCHQKTSTPASDHFDAKTLLDDPEMMWLPEAYFETEFSTSEPFTKVVPEAALHQAPSMASLSTISVCTIPRYLSQESLSSLRKVEDEQSPFNVSGSSTKTVTALSCSAIFKSPPQEKLSSNANIEDAKLIFQLLLLFLPPPNRRQLHLLFRVINKILRNGKFVLEVPKSMRHYLLETFLPAVVQSDKDYDFDMVSFMLDNCEFLFEPPSRIKEEVDDEIAKASAGRIKYSVDDICYLTYCEMVSKQQYEEQKASVSVQALNGLLEGILQDKNISEKDRRKRLKQFKENHPDIYLSRFPDEQNELQKKSKKTLFTKLVNLRL